MKQKVELCARTLCTGCLVCAVACPKGAVAIVRDHMGFPYPRINADQCVSCRLCAGKCHILTPVVRSVGKIAYRYSGGEKIQMYSSSGGFIPLLIQHCLAKGFFIGGAVFADDYLSVQYVVTRSANLIAKMRKSKYVEADLKDTFRKIKKLLHDGEQVLFVGLPCHVAALRSYVSDHKNLLSVDLICHGNGSPQYYSESLQSLCRKHGRTVGEVRNVDFRPKPEVVGQHGFRLDFADESLQIPSEVFPYYYGFSSRLILRDSCYQCRYTSMERAGDMTAGDSTFTDSKWGESLVLANTDRGTDTLAELLEYGGFRALCPEEMAALAKRFVPKYYPKLRKAVKRISKYEKLEKTYLSSKYVPVRYKIKRLIMSKIK